MGGKPRKSAVAVDHVRDSEDQDTSGRRERACAARTRDNVEDSGKRGQRHASRHDRRAGRAGNHRPARATRSAGRVRGER